LNSTNEKNLQRSSGDDREEQSMEQQHNSHALTDPGKLSRWKYAVHAFLSVGAIVLVSALVFLFYLDPFINTFLKGRITEAFREACPAYSIRIGGMHYDIWENRIGFDSVALTTMDSTLSCTIAAYSVSGIGWLELLWARGLVPHGSTGTVLDAHGIVVNFPQEQYELRCGLLRVSVPDSDIVVEALELHPLDDDEQFFAGSKFRKTRVCLVVPHARVAGLACLELLQGNVYHARSADIRDAFIDVLINKDKPVAKDTLSPPMPNEILTSIEQTIKIDSLTIWNGGLQYGERFAPSSKPAVITLDSMKASVRGIDSHADASEAIVIRAKGKFMKSTEMNIVMSIPISSPEFSFQYSGSLSRMDLSVLNSFLETAEQMRIKAGILQAATFEINVASGRASGNVRALYKDLTLAAINKHTGSEKGIFDVIASFVANNTKIRTNNMPGNSGEMKIGKVKYTRHRDDPFFRFVWFSLRSGVGDVVGF
jgi:hypothetical protein